MEMQALECGLKRTYDPHRVNYFLNHKFIHANCRAEGQPEYTDATAILTLPTTYCFTDKDICLLLYKNPDNQYEGDIYALPSKRGIAAKIAAREVIDFMFSQTDAENIVLHVPRFNKPSMYLAAGLGFKRTGVIKNARKMRGEWQDSIVYILEKSSWAA